MEIIEKKRILLVEDEDSLRKGMTINLELEGFEVISTDNGKEAINLINQQHFDVIILDVMLPEISGFQICEQIRLDGFNVPIIFVTAKDTSADKIAGLRLGADDYLSKPFNLEELLLRVHNLVKRSDRPIQDKLTSYSFGLNRVNFITYEASNERKGDFQLTRKEVMLLKLLVEKKGEVVSREQILQAVWGYDIYPSTRTIDNFILALRKYFEEDSKSPKFITSVRGVGYKFNN